MTVFIPAQYDGSKPACVYVKTDGYNPREKALLETLIATKEMPVTIGVFVRPGELPAADEGHDRTPQSLFRVRRRGRQQRPLPGRRAPAVRGQDSSI